MYLSNYYDIIYNELLLYEMQTIYAHGKQKPGINKCCGYIGKAQKPCCAAQC